MYGIAGLFFVFLLLLSLSDLLLCKNSFKINLKNAIHLWDWRTQAIRTRYINPTLGAVNSYRNKRSMLFRNYVAN